MCGEQLESGGRRTEKAAVAEQTEQAEVHYTDFNDCTLLLHATCRTLHIQYNRRLGRAMAENAA